MADIFDPDLPPLNLDDDETPKQVLARILQPNGPAVQGPAMPPPATPPRSGAAQSTPLTGSLATAPQQAQPKVSGPAMIPGVAAKPEDLLAPQRAIVMAARQKAMAMAAPKPDLLAQQRQKVLAYQRQKNQAAPTAPSLLFNSSGTPVDVPRGGVIRDLNGYASGHPLSALNPAPKRWAAQLRQARSGSAAATPFLGSGQSPLGLNNPSRITPAQKQTTAWNAGGPGPGAALSSIVPTATPDVTGSYTPPRVIAPRGTLEGDTAEYNRLQNTGSGISQIKRPWLRDLARIGDVGLQVVAPGVEPLIGGTEGHHDILLDQQQNRIAQDQNLAAARAKVLSYVAQQRQRQADANRADVLANAASPYVISPVDAQSIGHPELAGTRMTRQQLTDLQLQHARDVANLQTHTGGQAHTLSAADAQAVGVPALAGETISNDAWQRMVSGVQHDKQSGLNNSATNATRVRTTGMEDATSTANSERAHSQKGGSKAIPAAVRDRIESQKDVAIAKARSDFDSGLSSMDDYLNAWQAAQNDYEDRLSAQTGQPVPHTDIRSNVDAKGNWIGNRQTTSPQPQTHQQALPGSITHVFSPAAWQHANPRGNVAAAMAEARRLGYQVVQ